MTARERLVEVGSVEYGRIERFVMDRNITVADFAAAAGLPHSTVAGMFRRVHYWGRTQVRAETWAKIDGYLTREGA